MAAKGTGSGRVIFLKFRADHQMSTKSSNNLQVEDIVLCKILKKGPVPKVVVRLIILFI